MNQQKKISKTTLALLLFIAVFGMSNIPNNYAALGNQAIGWFILLIIYFVPIALMMAELGSYDPKSNSGMTGWISLGMGKFFGFLGAWTYFVANIFYIPMLASRVPVFLSWSTTADFNSLDEVVNTSGVIPGVITASSNQILFLSLGFLTVVVAIVIGIYFEKIFNALGNIVGWLSLGVTSLFVLLAILSVPLFANPIANPITISSITPTFSVDAVSTFAWILFAIAGIETVGSYIGRIDKPATVVPKGIMNAALITSFAYIIGFVAMAFIFSPDEVSTDSLESLIAVVYAKAGIAWGLGEVYLKLVMFIYVLITITALVLWLVSTISVLFETLPKGIISDKLSELKINGIPLVGTIFTGIMILLFLIVSNSSTSENIYLTLYDMTTTAVLFPYVLVAISYMMYRKKGLKGQYQMVKNDVVAYFVSAFVLLVTLAAVVFSSYDLSIPAGPERISWLITSGGGVIFFVLIGIAIYIRTNNINLSYIMLLILFTIAALVFSNLIYLFVAVILIIWILEKYVFKK